MPGQGVAWVAWETISSAACGYPGRIRRLGVIHGTLVTPGYASQIRSTSSLLLLVKSISEQEMAVHLPSREPRMHLLLIDRASSEPQFAPCRTANYGAIPTHKWLAGFNLDAGWFHK